MPVLPDEGRHIDVISMCGNRKKTDEAGRRLPHGEN
jgi:hypothetical protein